MILRARPRGPRNHLVEALPKMHLASVRSDHSRLTGTLFTFAGIRKVWPTPVFQLLL